MASFRTKDIDSVRDLIHTRPVTAILWLAGAIAIIGSPPFGTFLSELTILGGMMNAGNYGAAVVYLLTLGIIFTVLSAKVLPMIFSRPTEENGKVDALPEMNGPEPLWSTVPLAVFGTLSLILGVYMPPWLSTVIERITLYVGGQ